MKAPMTDDARIAGLREVIDAAQGDWHEATALLSVGADLHWLLRRSEVAAPVAQDSPALREAAQAVVGLIDEPRRWSLSYRRRLVIAVERLRVAIEGVPRDH